MFFKHRNRPAEGNKKKERTEATVMIIDSSFCGEERVNDVMLSTLEVKFTSSLLECCFNSNIQWVT